MTESGKATRTESPARARRKGELVTDSSSQTEGLAPQVISNETGTHSDTHTGTGKAAATGTGTDTDADRR
eukprot:3938972-Pleurochrysis_carterae.AAC.1